MGAGRAKSVFPAVAGAPFTRASGGRHPSPFRGALGAWSGIASQCRNDVAGDFLGRNDELAFGRQEPWVVKTALLGGDASVPPLAWSDGPTGCRGWTRSFSETRAGCLARLGHVATRLDGANQCRRAGVYLVGSRKDPELAGSRLGGGPAPLSTKLTAPCSLRTERPSQSCPEPRWQVARPSRIVRGLEPSRPARNDHSGRDCYESL